MKELFIIGEQVHDKVFARHQNILTMKNVTIILISIIILNNKLFSQTVSFDELKQMVSFSKEKTISYLQKKGFEYLRIHISQTGDSVSVYSKKSNDETFYVGGQWIPEKGEYSNAITFMSNNKKYITDYIKVATSDDFAYISKNESENGIHIYYMNPKYTMQIIFSNSNDDPSLLKLVEKSNQ